LAEELKDDVGVRDLLEAELEEILYATRPPVHERQVSSYGALVYRPVSPTRGRGKKRTTKKRQPVRPEDEWHEVEFADLDEARFFADGRVSFLVRGSSRDRLRVFPGNVGDELSLALRTTGRWTAVQRTSGGGVRIFRRNRILTRDAGSRWWSKPSAQLYRDGLRNSIAGAKDLTLASSILDLCVHQLSSAGVGATIVQRCFKGPQLKFLDTQHAFDLPKLSVLESSNHAAIRSALGQLDRAAIVDSNGHLVRVGVTLNSDPVKAQSTRTTGGTRHNSACAFSASEPNCLVHVVSSDGPVTVFRAGIALVTTSGFLDEESEHKECPKCGIAEVDVDEDGPSIIGYSSSDPGCEVCGGEGSLTEVRTVMRSYS
jgi:hypothetical protein